MATPAKKAVHFDPNSPALSEFSTADSSSDSIVTTSSLQYLNAQLIAHGFAPSPGLCLDGISDSNLGRTVKCLLDLLGQRVRDMARTEELSTTLRTLKYDHERLTSMYRSSEETAANCEREMVLFKSRLATATKSLQASETAHKKTTLDLQRTRTDIQALRVTHQNEVKRKEKEVEKMTEKWAKIADVQTKLHSAHSGLTRCANSAVVEGSEFIGKGDGFLEVALEQSERARNELATQNQDLKTLVLLAVNQCQSVLAEAKRVLVGKSDEIIPYTLTTLFPMASTEHAGEKLQRVLSSLKDSLVLLQPAEPSTEKSPGPNEEELDLLHNVVEDLKEQLETTRSQLAAETRNQTVLDRFLSDQKLQAGNNPADVSVELMTSTESDEVRERLDSMRRELDEERQKFTQATVKLGHERKELEASRARFKEEQRRWEVERMLSEMPPTPPEILPESPSRKKSPKKADSPRKSLSPRPIRVGKAGEAKRGRHAKKLSLSPPHKLGVEPPYETEYIPPPAVQASKPTRISLLPTTFALPPPSPSTSLPTTNTLLMSGAILDSIPLPPLPSLPPPTPIVATPSVPSTPQSQTKPHRRFFPAAGAGVKPLHAYSPAKPSPLSRILMLAESPYMDEPMLDPVLEAPDEEEEEKDVPPEEMFPAVKTPEQPPAPAMTLAQELGVSDSPPDSPIIMVRPESPLQERKIRLSNVNNAKGRAAQNNNGVGRGGGVKSKPDAVVVSKGSANVRRPIKVIEKENAARRKTMGPDTKVKETTTTTTKSSSRPPPSQASASKPKTSGRLLIPTTSGSGPRRVLVGSAEAPPVKTKSLKA